MASQSSSSELYMDILAVDDINSDEPHNHPMDLSSEGTTQSQAGPISPMNIKSETGNGDTKDGSVMDGRIVSSSPATSAPGTPSRTHTARNFLTHRKAYIGNLTWWTTEEDVQGCLENIGVSDYSIKIFENRANGQSKGYCLIAVESETSMKAMFEKLGTQEIHGKNPKVTRTDEFGHKFEATTTNEKIRKQFHPNEFNQNCGHTNGTANANMVPLNMGMNGSRMQMPAQFGPGGMPPFGNHMRPQMMQAGPQPQGLPPPFMVLPDGPCPRPPPRMLQQYNFSSPHQMGPCTPPLISQCPPHKTNQHQQFQQQHNFQGPPFRPPQNFQYRSDGPPEQGPTPRMPAQRFNQTENGLRPPPVGPVGQMNNGVRGFSRYHWRPARSPGQPHAGNGPMENDKAVRGETPFVPRRHQFNEGPPPPLCAPHINPDFINQMPNGLMMYRPPYDQGPPPPPECFTRFRGDPVDQKPPPRHQAPNKMAACDTELEDLVHRNRSVSSAAISRAVADSASGDRAGAVETLVTAINLISESKVANDERCKILLSSLEDTLHSVRKAHPKYDIVKEERRAHSTDQRKGSRPRGRVRRGYSSSDEEELQRRERSRERERMRRHHVERTERRRERSRSTAREYRGHHRSEREHAESKYHGDRDDYVYNGHEPEPEFERKRDVEIEDTVDSAHRRVSRHR